MRLLRPGLARVWSLWANACGLLTLSFGVGWAIVLATQGDTTVLSVSEARVEVSANRIEPADARPITISARPGGQVIYFFDGQRHKLCRGEVVRVWVRLDEASGGVSPRDPVTITHRRPITEQRVGIYDDVKAIVDVPRAAVSGLWSFEAGLQSECPTGPRYDRIVRFRVRVEGGAVHD